ncbi:hypothetical protein A2963_03480 [Candidatus Roizmanbacteria bacterium RIFCSPLOWO2_01_FULL_40_13]|nr:MAG: hypothetical protein A2963_03480 [Candidatus Roizmanbacteria bacterium RIFCSPLOWO2_01_FULL_40_13]
MKTQNNNLDNFFHIASRFTMVFPVAALIIAVLVKYSQGRSIQKNYQQFSFTATPKQNINLPEFLTNSNKASPSANFNLEGPLSCYFRNDSTIVNAYVLDKRIYVKSSDRSEVNNYLLNGDCIYLWVTGSYTGEKICGISGQLKVVESLLGSGLIDAGSIFTNLGKLLDIPQTDGSDKVLSSALNACKKEEIPESIKFETPKNILFKNKKLN